jgi:hypothetical protein
MNIGEVASAASGDQDFFTDAFCVVEQDDASSAASGLERAHQAGRASSQDDDINLLHADSPLNSCGLCSDHFFVSDRFFDSRVVLRAIGKHVRCHSYLLVRGLPLLCHRLAHFGPLHVVQDL